MADINLADLMQARQAEAAVTTDKALTLSKEQEIAQVTKAVETLSPEERRQVDELKERINLMDSTTALSYGSEAQKEIADFSNNILSSVRGKDSGQVGALLGELVTKVKEFEPEEEKSFFRKLPLIGSIANKASNIMADYDKLSTQVEKIQGELEKAKMRMMKDVVMFDGLYEKNLSYFKALQLYIRAGEEKLEEMRSATLPKLRQQASASGDPMAVQVVNDFENSVERFEKKVHDLKLSKTIAIQTAPQIRLIQNNDKILVDRVQTAIYNTIPLWKNQLVIALGLSRQQQVLQLQRAVSDTTNELLKRNAELLKTNTVETARENERGIVDIATVKKVNEDLIATIEQTVKIQQEGREKRQAAERELLAIEERLKDTLLANSQR
ncbi:MAG: toxic anion resistance protein [Selenomonadaceae bacterium]|nr:toxic anion resistance protein [Selenomonadaceae bacterium]